jgi:hypothetical protein
VAFIALDPDVICLMRECARRVQWDSVSELINSSLRAQLAIFRPPGLPITVDHKAQIAFNPEIRKR